MKSFVVLFSFILLALTTTAVQASGDTNKCVNSYGTSIECPKDKITIDKKVRMPNNVNSFLDNLTSANPYAPSDEVEYELSVTNTSDVEYQTVTVIDTFPGQVTFVSGPGRYEVSGNKLTYEISNLKPGHNNTVRNRIIVKLKDAATFSGDTCEVVNTALATGPNGQSDQDTARLCVRKVTVPTLPVAGFEDWAFVIPFLALAVIGFGILNKGAIRST